MIIATDKNVGWPGDRAMSSYDGAWDGTLLPSPSPTEAVWKGHTCVGPPPTGPLSPVSSRMETVMDESSVSTTAHSAPSSCADSWSIGHGDHEEGDNEATWNQWEHSRTESMTVLKLESTDDDIKLGDMTVAPVRSPTSPDTSKSKQKRPRGRPRKTHPTVSVSTSKVTKGRSKTGCITCRKRKKKCDEAKPRCKFFPALYIAAVEAYSVMKLTIHR